MEQVTKTFIEKYSPDVKLSQEGLTNTIAKVSYNLLMLALTNDPADIQNTHRSTIFQQLKDHGVPDDLDKCCKTIAQAIVDAYDPESILNKFREYENSTTSDSTSGAASATNRNSAVFFADIKISNLIAWSNKLTAKGSTSIPSNMKKVERLRYDPITKKNYSISEYEYTYESALAILLPDKLIKSDRPVKERNRYTISKSEPNLRSHVVENHKGPDRWPEEYRDLSWDKLISDLKNASLNDAEVLAAIKGILFQSPGALQIINKERQSRVIELTYHLIVTESRLHPAAILHTLLAFQLHETDPKTWSFEAVMEKLPFKEKRSVAVSRNIQREFGRDENRHTTPYYYDGGPIDKKVTACQKQYSEKEFQLWNDWLESKETNNLSAALPGQAQVAQPEPLQSQDAQPEESQSQDAQPKESYAEIKMKLNKLFQDYFGFDNCLV